GDSGPLAEFRGFLVVPTASFLYIRLDATLRLSESVAVVPPRRPHVRHTYQAVHHDVPGVLHLGGLVPLDLRVSAEPPVQSDGTGLDPGDVQPGRLRGHVLQYPVRRP